METHRLRCYVRLCAIRLPLKVPSLMDEFDFGFSSCDDQESECVEEQLGRQERERRR